jgi:hypothetical protein
MGYIDKTYAKGKNYIRGNDMFGHTINLNFDKNGDTYKTSLGGTLSFMIRCAITLYVYIRLKKLAYNESDSNYTEIGVVNLDDDPEF